MKTFKTLLLTIITLLYFAPSYGQLKVISSGFVGVGTADPARPLEVVGQVMSTNFNTYPQNKQSNFLMRHYDQTNTHFAYFNASSDANNNQVLFGGGAGTQYSATVVAFMTGANNTTLLGTERMRVNNQGRVRMNTDGGTGAITHALTLITGDASKPGGGSWATPSDARIKQNVRPFTDGLEQVLQIDPVYFSYKSGTGFDPQKEYVGIIAQEMQKIAPYTVEEVRAEPELGEEPLPNMPSSILTYNGTAVTYMLINAIKEHQAMIDERDDKIEELEARLQRIEAALLGNGATNPAPAVGNSTEIVLSASDAAILKQNQPNPFSHSTTIEYALPRTVKSASMRISNTNGVTIRIIELEPTAGAGVLNIKTNDFPAGEYIYSLTVDGKLVDSKKMVLSN